MNPSDTQDALMSTKQTSLRLPTDAWERAECVAEHMADKPEFEGLSISPSRVLIQAALRGLTLLEEEHGVTKKKGRKR